MVFLAVPIKSLYLIYKFYIVVLGFKTDIITFKYPETLHNCMSDNIEYQVGGNQIDNRPNITGDDDNVIEFDFETGAVFKRLADDIYETPEAGIREPLTNSITTIRRAFANKNELGVIKITVQDGDRVKLRIRDNGEGIPKPILEEVLTVIGRSNARDDGDLSGMYGMGFLACYKLVGMSGGFVMSTNPRDSQYEAYSGFFKPGVFEYDEEGSMQILDGDDYGTVFEFYVDENIGIESIRDWVDKHARWSPVPVIYNEYDEDGNEEFNEDYHSTNLSDQYGDKPSISISNDYYEVATSPDSKSDIVLISSPVSMRGTRSLRKNLPWSVDLRIKYENGIVFKGPNKGLVPTDKKNYESLSDSRKKDYIPKEELSEDDMTLPEPTGTREKLRRNREFINYVNNQLIDKYLEIVENTLDDFDPDTTSLSDLDSMENHIILRIFSEFNQEDEYTKDEISNTINSEFHYDPNDELVEFFQTMTKEISLVSENKISNKYPTKRAYELYDNDNNIFMCTSNQNSWKNRAVEESEDVVIKVNTASEYEPFEKHLNWTPLKNIKKSNACEILDINEDIVEDIYDSNRSKSKDISERDITVHTQSGGRNTVKRDTSSLIDIYNNSRKNNRFGEYLVLFPQSSDYYVSNHYSLADNYCCVASCSKSVKEKLTSESENIVTFDQYVNKIKNIELKTSHGDKTLCECINEDEKTVLHISKKQNMEPITMNELAIHLYNNDELFENIPIYSQIEKSEWCHIINIHENIENSESIVLLEDNVKVSTYIKHNIRKNTVDMYLRSRLDEKFIKSNEYYAIDSKFNKISKQLIQTVNLIKKSMDTNGIASNKTTSENKKDISLPEHETKDGHMTLKEVYNKYKPEHVMIHVLSMDEISKFKNDKYLEDGAKILSGIEFGTTSIKSGIYQGTYIPILESQFEIVQNYIKEGTTVIGYYNYNNDNYINLDSNIIYAYLKLNDWNSEFITDLLKNMSSNDNSKEDLIETLSYAHDNGVNPKNLI